jgi:hypothetical protein
MDTSHIQNCIKQLRKRITDPADVVWLDTIGLSFTESCIIQENERIQKVINLFSLELVSRGFNIRDI